MQIFDIFSFMFKTTKFLKLRKEFIDFKSIFITFLFFMCFRFFSCLTALSTALMSIDIPFMKFTTIIKDFINLTSKNINTNYLNGIKTISLVSIFAVHSWGLRFFFLFKDGENSKNYQTNFAAIAFLFGTIVMDLFFIIGGYLTTRGLKKLYNEG